MFHTNQYYVFSLYRLTAYRQFTFTSFSPTWCWCRAGALSGTSSARFDQNLAGAGAENPARLPGVAGPKIGHHQRHRGYGRGYPTLNKSFRRHCFSGEPSKAVTL